MINEKGFEEWLKHNTTFSNAVVKDVICRVKRADKIIEYDDTETYLFYLGQADSFKHLSVSVRSQLRRAVKLYTEYKENKEEA